ncbi:type II toxin-antitoxin system VapC family toxin [Ramlibacter albus]|uniref:Ribonuclease VapC n=1 Tax=Ramlibacter albus TaxID=2079448 RepID=A0A923S2L1_9BURK|nr:type II toxin-antitoxin system VapC family toxin [Ramlibacter albus]
MIVVDTNVIAYFHLQTEHTALAEGLLEQDPEWVAPVLWRSEFRNILAGYLRREDLDFQQACRLQRDAESMFDGSEYDVDSRSVLELVRDSNCTAYDCEFVALAMKLGTRLVTVDKKVLRAFPQQTVALAEA